MSDSPKINESELPLAKRRAQLAKLKQLVANLDSAIEKYASQASSLSQLNSVSKGLYDEIDKLAKKAPAESVTELALGSLNDLIKEAKELIEDDKYIDRINVFVPAGDNPQHRDAILVLRQIRDGLERFGIQLNVKRSKIANRREEAAYISLALRFIVDIGEVPAENQMKYNIKILNDEWLDNVDFSVTSKWINDSDEFDFAKLDKLNIEKYFSS